MNNQKKNSTRSALITVSRKRPDGSLYRMNYLIEEAEEMETPEHIIPIAAEMLADWKEEVAQHPSEPPSPLITFPGQ